MCRCPQRPEEGVRSPEAGVTGGCGLPKVDAGNRTLDLGKSSECFNHWTISLAKHPHMYITTVNKRSVFMEGFLFLVRSWNPRFSSLTVRAWQILEASHPQFCSMWNAVLHLMKAFKGFINLPQVRVQVLPSPLFPESGLPQLTLATYLALSAAAQQPNLLRLGVQQPSRSQPDACRPKSDEEFWPATPVPFSCSAHSDSS